MAIPKSSRPLEMSVERIANGYLVTELDKQPVYCEDEEAVQGEINSRIRIFCKKTEVLERGRNKVP